MKSVFLAFALILSFVSFTQPADNSKLKPFIDKFNQYMEEIKKIESGAKTTAQPVPANKNSEYKSEAPAGENNNVVKLKIIADNAKRQIEHIKKRDPNYDVSKMEALIQPYFDAQQASVDANKNRLKASIFHDSDEGCYGLFKKNTTTEFRQTGNVEEDTKTHIAQLEAYNKLLENILKNHMAGVETCHDYIKTRTDDAKQRLAELIRKMEIIDAEIGVKQLYRELLGEEAYWKAAMQLYPDISGAAEVHAAIQKQIQSVGGLDGLLAKAKARKMERLKNTFMPKAVVVNAALEAEFKEAFLAEGWGETIIKINIQTREWSVIRNSLTGAILYRTQSAAIVAKQKTGNCIMYDFAIKQQYTGSGYSSVSSRSSHGILADEFLCENAKK